MKYLYKSINFASIRPRGYEWQPSFLANRKPCSFNNYRAFFICDNPLHPDFLITSENNPCTSSAVFFMSPSISWEHEPKVSMSLLCPTRGFQQALGELFDDEDECVPQRIGRSPEIPAPSR
jgi:hypothetical protein